MDMQNIESDEISLINREGKEWFGLSTISMEDYFISWNYWVLLGLDLFLYQKTFIATCLCLRR
jgi:hypothetical protein